MTTGTSQTTPAPTLRDRLRREAYLTRFAWHMQDYPGREYRRVKRELRAEITAAAADVGTDAALRDLGHPAALAHGYLSQLDRHRPHYATGAVAAGLTVGLFLYLGLAYTAGTVDTLLELGGGTATRYPLGAETTFVATDDELSVESTFSLAGVGVVLGCALVAFALGSRIWRAWT